MHLVIFGPHIQFIDCLRERCDRWNRRIQGPVPRSSSLCPLSDFAVSEREDNSKLYSNDYLKNASVWFVTAFCWWEFVPENIEYRYRWRFYSGNQPEFCSHHALLCVVRDPSCCDRARRLLDKPLISVAL